MISLGSFLFLKTQHLKRYFALLFILCVFHHVSIWEKLKELEEIQEFKDIFAVSAICFALTEIWTCLGQFKCLWLATRWHYSPTVWVTNWGFISLFVSFSHIVYYVGLARCFIHLYVVWNTPHAFAMTHQNFETQHWHETMKSSLFEMNEISKFDKHPSKLGHRRGLQVGLVWSEPPYHNSVSKL